MMQYIPELTEGHVPDLTGNQWGALYQCAESRRPDGRSANALLARGLLKVERSPFRYVLTSAGSDLLLALEKGLTATLKRDLASIPFNVRWCTNLSIITNADEWSRRPHWKPTRRGYRTLLEAAAEAVSLLAEAHAAKLKDGA
jgi:hypothetical protein